MNFSYKGVSYKAGDEIEVVSEEERKYLGNHIFSTDFRMPDTKEMKKAVSKVVRKKTTKKIKK